jgi:uncharacterized coiled-coil protein SlyX
MAKNNQKCVRMSDEILDVVESMAGDGFNEKFENIVRNYKMEQPALYKEIEDLNHIITNKRKTITEYQEKINKLSSVLYKLQALEQTIDQLIKQNVSQ